MTIQVEPAGAVTPDLIDALARLIPQLSRSAPAPGETELAEIVASEATELLVARNSDDGSIVGTLTLVLFRTPTGLRAWIEDVVVDEAARGLGVAKALNQHALALAAARGVRSVDLTSRPSREAANQLYQRLGFARRETNVYRYDVDTR